MNGRRSNLADTVFENLKEAILCGDYGKDSLLPTQEELARSFGVSRTVMRDAFHKLSSLGFIEIRQGKGSFVRSTQPISIVPAVSLIQNNFKMEEPWIRDLMEARYYLEQSIVRLAAARILPGDITALQENVARMAEAVSAGDMPAFAAIDLVFHERLSEVCGNKILQQTVGAIRGVMKNFFDGFSRTPGVAPRALVYHRDILKAVRVKNPAAAARAMKAHLADISINLKKNYGINVLL
ncbi:MAG: FadR family transcriptional regulator [Spirochaetales bacterium]|nr:FadR family transcriptional regulator [Spirochaetales bacterium]